MTELTQADQGIHVEAALANPEVTAVRSRLVGLIKSGKGSAFLASRFETGAKVSMTSDLGVVDTTHRGNGGHHDVSLYDGLGFAARRTSSFEGFTSWASIADNREGLTKQGVLKYDASLNREAVGGAPMLVTLITDRRKLQEMGFDSSLSGYCVVTAEVATDVNKMLDSAMRQGQVSTMKYIIPTDLGENIARIAQQEGPAAAWAIMFDTVGYRLKRGPEADYGVPNVNLTDKGKLGVAYLRGKDTAPATSGDAPKKRGLFSR